jgi:hypothetical protein
MTIRDRFDAWYNKNDFPDSIPREIIKTIWMEGERSGYNTGLKDGKKLGREQAREEVIEENW